MTEEELNTISNNIKEKIGEEAFATISDDMGKIIGKHGRIANAIRVIMKAAGSVQHKKVFVEIVE